MTKKAEEKESSDLGWKVKAGIVASILYAIAAIFILGINLCYSLPSPPLGLNEIGDYLAGAFSPLAFLWLVIGYLIQSRELKNNNTSLEKQIEEFEKNIALSKENFDHQMERYDHETKEKSRLAQPIFETITVDYKDPHDLDLDGYSITIRNVGEDIFDFVIYDGSAFICDHINLKKDNPTSINIYQKPFSDHETNEIKSETLKKEYNISFYDNIRLRQKTTLTISISRLDENNEESDLSFSAYIPPTFNKYQ